MCTHVETKKELYTAGKRKKESAYTLDKYLDYFFIKENWLICLNYQSKIVLEIKMR